MVVASHVRAFAAQRVPLRPAPRAVVRAVAAGEAETPPVQTAPAETERKAGPLEKGGTLKGEAAAGKDAGAVAKAAVAGASAVQRMQIVDGYFRDDRWVNGTWDFECFKKANGETDWDLVIDAEMARRKLLEDYPIPSRVDDPVNFDTEMIPWWAWVRRFHLPEAEKLNGRAAMVGYFAALVVDNLSGAGLVDQQESFFGKLLLFITIMGVCLIRNTSDVEKYKGLLDEATFYDKQWNATWEGQVRPSEKKEQ